MAPVTLEEWGLGEEKWRVATNQAIFLKGESMDNHGIIMGYNGIIMDYNGIMNKPMIPMIILWWIFMIIK